MKKIEIVMWYKCNCRCEFCSSPSMRGDGFTTREIAALLSSHRTKGATVVDFGGGEPAARNDLPVLARAAAELGYETIGVKSNGMRFCYPDYVETCMKSGVNEFSISMWGYPASAHDRMAGRDGAFEMTEMGLKHLVDFGADVCVDFLLTSYSIEALSGALEHLSGKVGVRKFRLWLFSMFGAGGQGEDMTLSLTQAGKSAAAAYRAVRDNVDWIKTSHIPPCLLDGEPSMYYNVKDLNLFVITPGHSFMGEDSPFEKGIHVAECRACRLAAVCAGPREEYVRTRGASEVKAVK